MEENMSGCFFSEHSVITYSQQIHTANNNNFYYSVS